MNQLVLTIKKGPLQQIVKGKKVEEYRDSKEFYHKIFKELDTETFHVLNAPKTVLLRNGYLKTKEHKVKEKNGMLYESPLDQSKPYFIIEVEKIVHEGFFDFIPENFEKGDLAYTIYIKSVLEHNLNIE